MAEFKVKIDGKEVTANEGSNAIDFYKDRKEVVVAKINGQLVDLATPLKNGEGQFSEFTATWKPDKRTKEQKLANIDIGSNYPSETEFNDFLDEIDQNCRIAEYRPDLYIQLCENKWHQWRDDLGKWVKVRNWKSYVQSLADKIDDDMPRN